MSISTDLINQLGQFLLGIALLIFVHELGHFFAARLLKVQVEEFGIGFPPRLIKLFEAGGTQFTFNWIPLGGFVRLKGENDPEIPGGLAAAKPWVRLAVLFAGPVTNLSLGIILSIFLFYSRGTAVPGRIEIKEVAPNSPAYIAGLQAHDLILQVEEKIITTTDELSDAIRNRLGKPTKIVYQRVEVVGEVTLTPRQNPPPEEGAMGIRMGNETKSITIMEAVPLGMRASAEFIWGIFLLPVSLLQGDISPEQARPVGYKGMFDIYQQISDPIWFFMMISMSLGIFNLLPIPALDGGRVLLTLPEIIIRRRVPPRYENMIHMVGFTMLLLMLIYINLQDFLNPVKLPF